MIPTEPYDGVERRRHPRFHVELSVDLEVRSPKPNSSLEWIHVRGLTKDLSLGGMSLRLGDALEVDTECIVHFHVPTQQISPPTTGGTVIRCAANSSGTDIAVQLSPILETLKLPLQMA